MGACTVTGARKRHVRLLRDVADYLEQGADELALFHRNPVTRKVEPERIASEIVRVRRWSQQLRTAALREFEVRT